MHSPHFPPSQNFPRHNFGNDETTCHACRILRFSTNLGCKCVRLFIWLKQHINDKYKHSQCKNQTDYTPPNVLITLTVPPAAKPGFSRCFPVPKFPPNFFIVFSSSHQQKTISLYSMYILLAATNPNFQGNS